MRSQFHTHLRHGQGVESKSWRCLKSVWLVIDFGKSQALLHIFGLRRWDANTNFSKLVISQTLFSNHKMSFKSRSFSVQRLKSNLHTVETIRYVCPVVQRLWVIWGQCCPRVAAVPSLPNGQITQLSPYFSQKPGRVISLPLSFGWK